MVHEHVSPTFKKEMKEMGEQLNLLTSTLILEMLFKGRLQNNNDT